MATTADHLVYMGAWRDVGGGNYKLIGANRVWSTKVGYNYFSVPESEQFTVQTGDLLGVHYQSSRFPTELLVVPYAGNYERLQGWVSALDSGFEASYGQKEISTMTNSTLNLGYNVNSNWRTPQVQAIIQP